MILYKQGIKILFFKKCLNKLHLVSSSWNEKNADTLQLFPAIQNGIECKKGKNVHEVVKVEKIIIRYRRCTVYL